MTKCTKKERSRRLPLGKECSDNWRQEPSPDAKSIEERYGEKQDVRIISERLPTGQVQTENSTLQWRNPAEGKNE